MVCKLSASRGVTLTLAGAVLIAVLVSVTLFVSPAKAYDPFTGRSVASMSLDEKRFRMDKFFQATNPSFHTTSSEAQAQLEAIRRQQITTRAARTSFKPGLGTHLVTKGGLAGAAAGIWVHNGITLYNAAQCGQTDCPDPIYLDATFRQAEELTSSSTGASGNYSVIKRKDSAGNLVGAAMLTSASVTYQGNNCVVKASWSVAEGSSLFPTDSIGNFSISNRGDQPSGKFPSSCVQSFTVTKGGVTTETYNKGDQCDPTKPSHTAGGLRVFSSGNGPGATTGSSGKLWDICVGGMWENPVFDWGETAVVPTAPSGGYSPTLSQVDTFYDSTVADPEAPAKEDDPETEEDETLEPVEVNPDRFDEEWEDEQTWREIIEREFGNDPAGWPNGDPDEDGQPNKEDTDDDGDGEPDETDPNPFTTPVEAPHSDPDEDGLDNDEDEDDDNDGIPDEYDPNPYVDTPLTDLPPEHDYADIDEDGIPNKDDLDDDGDGIPDEYDPDPLNPTEPDQLEEYHPFSDPDVDGTPNKDDLDDDDDGKDDWIDLTPWVPDPPGQGDGDGDTVPDWRDPWPGNPFAPSRPGIDEDEDDIPDYNDPVPGDPTVPWNPTRQHPGTPTSPAPPASPETPRWPFEPSQPVQPTNKEYPSDPTWRNDPTGPDLTNNENPTTPVTRDKPDDPTIPGTPDPPTRCDPLRQDCDEDDDDGEGLISCPRPPTWEIEGPQAAKYQTLFPFNLLLMVKEAVEGIAAPPKTPPVPILFPEAQAGYDQFDLSVFDWHAWLVRTIFSVAGTIGAGLMLYRLFSGSHEGE